MRSFPRQMPSNRRIFSAQTSITIRYDHIVCSFVGDVQRDLVFSVIYKCKKSFKEIYSSSSYKKKKQFIFCYTQYFFIGSASYAFWSSIYQGKKNMGLKRKQQYFCTDLPSISTPNSIFFKFVDRKAVLIVNIWEIAFY